MDEREPPEGWSVYWKTKVAADLAESEARHARVCAGLDGGLLKVAQLHAPFAGTKRVLCEGCDMGWEDCVGDWPCPTWELIEEGVS